MKWTDWNSRTTRTHELNVTLSHNLDITNSILEFEDYDTLSQNLSLYGVATISRLLKITGLFCRI